MNKPIAQRFEERWIPVPWSGCWEWTMGRDSKGYGTISFKGQSSTRAHRLSWELHRGPIPDGMHVLHKCDNPGCVNPDHLFIGTHDDNMADKAAKGRAPSMAGEACPVSVLTDEAIDDIRREYATGLVKQRELAAKHGVSQTNISSIVRRATWRH